MAQVGDLSLINHKGALRPAALEFTRLSLKKIRNVRVPAYNAWLPAERAEVSMTVLTNDAAISVWHSVV